jgi:hypothetical protein
MSVPDPDRLYGLLPVVHRLRDAERGYPLRALLQVIAEQVNAVDADIAQLYDNWFIETCQEWVVPYIGELVGYTPLYDTGEPAPVNNPRAQARERILISRREVANTVRFRRRKGTIAVLEELATAVAGWPAKAVEFYRLLGVTQNINYPHLKRGRLLDVRDGPALEDLGTAFERSAHAVDVRCIGARRGPELYNISAVGVFVWRLKAYSITQTPALSDDTSPNCYLFNPLGHDTQLFNQPQPLSGGSPGVLNLPTSITRRRLQGRVSTAGGKTTRSGIPAYYGSGKSFEIWTGSPRVPLDPGAVVVADLTDWTYRAKPGQVAVDPQLGRIAFPPTQTRRQGVWVSYSYGFSADMGGGEYDRTLSQPANHTLYLVGEGETFTRINDALTRWTSDSPTNAVIEITDSGVYVEPIEVTLKPGQTLQLRAANRKRPVIRLLNWQTSASNNLIVTGLTSNATGGATAGTAAVAVAPKSTTSSATQRGGWFTLDGIVVTGRGIQVQGSLCGLVIRHSTLVPGWGLECDCKPTHPLEPSLELDGAPDCVRIEHSIVGTIQVNRDEVREDPCRLQISDSILDATSLSGVVLGAPESLCAFAILDIRRCTVFGQVQTRAIELAENCIFMSTVLACRRQDGCVRFCYLPADSRTPRRYECQPDLVLRQVTAVAQRDGLSNQQRNTLLLQARQRVEPEFNNTRYGASTYCQLADRCAREITAGADDSSELGAFHDLYQPQRAANLTARLAEYTPSGMSAGVVYET